MVLIYYDENGFAGSGSVYYQDISGGIPIIAHQLIANDYIAAGVGDSNIVKSIVARWTTFLKVNDLGIIKSFTSTPETRWRLGTYVPHGGYLFKQTPEGEQIVPYYKDPEYLIYTEQQLGTYFVNIPIVNPGYGNYNAIFGPPNPINYNVALQEPWIDQNAFRSLNYAVGMDVNLVDTILVSMQFYYTFVSLFTSTADSRTVAQITL